MVSLGQNVGSEVNGKSDRFSRPQVRLQRMGLSMPLSKNMKRLALALMLLPTTTEAHDCVSKVGDEPEGRKVTLKNVCATGAFVKITCNNGQLSSLYIQPCKTAWFSVGAACGDPHVGWQFENPTSETLCRR